MFCDPSIGNRDWHYSHHFYLALRKRRAKKEKEEEVRKDGDRIIVLQLFELFFLPSG